MKGVAVGAGYFAQFHLDAWQRLPGAALVALCDADPARAQALARQFGIQRTYTDVAEMFLRERPDFIDIITPPDTHLALVELAAQAGVAIICQKPVAPTLAEARQLVALTEQTGVRLMIHENFRFQPWYRAVRHLLDNHAIGDTLFSINCRTRLGDGWQSDAYLSRQPYFRTMPRLLIHETGVHFIDTFRFLAGEVDQVYANLSKRNNAIAGEDSGQVFFVFKKGATAIWDASRYNEPNYPNPRYTFGEMTLDGNGGTIRLYPDGRLTIQPLGKPETEHPYPHEDRGFTGDCVLATQQHFIDCLLSGQPFETGGRVYLTNLIVQEAIYQSAHEGRVVSIG
jgi:D-apiose dehydrogenase